jgi:hypothetical protein
MILSIQQTEALYKIYSNITYTVGNIAYDANNNVVSYDVEAVQAYVDAHAYIAKRQAEYPPLADFADAYYWSQNGDNTKMTAYLEKCDEVKSKYPKP